MSVLDLVRPDLRALQPYSSARNEASGGTILLNANESPWPAGPAPHHRYPDPQPRELVAQLAALYGVRDDEVLATRGSDEGIDLLVRAFCRAGQDGVALCSPTFGMYAVSAQVQGAAIVDVPLAADFAFDADALLARIDARVKIVFVCTPNNPTGQLVPLSTIERLATSVRDRSVVVVDEAYIEFAGTPSAAGLIAAHDNVIVLRTLSKAHALAGARIGATIARAEVIAFLRRILPAYPLPTPCIDAALAALTAPALAATAARVAALVEGRDQMRALLRGVPQIVEIFPSAANFLLVRCTDAAALYRRLVARGVIVRDVSRQPALANCLRISVGSEAEIDGLIAALDIEAAA